MCLPRLERYEEVALRLVSSESHGGVYRLEGALYVRLQSAGDGVGGQPPIGCAFDELYEVVAIAVEILGGSSTAARSPVALPGV